MFITIKTNMVNFNFSTFIYSNTFNICLVSTYTNFSYYNISFNNINNVFILR